MKFRTEINVEPFGHGLDYGEGIFSVGSCFAQNMAAKLSEAKFTVTSSPSGILFNPESIACAIERFAERRAVCADDLIDCGGRWCSFDFHSDVSDADPAKALQKMNDAVRTGAAALRRARTLIVTFGTAWVYELRATGKVVANCHKRPAAEFVRRRLTVQQIEERWTAVVERFLADKDIILTVSPVRHLADGAEDNSLSKATLRLATDTLCRRFGNVRYFPSFEIMNDDLRDYRFYADDLAHPSQQAVDYIWEKFRASALSPRATTLLPQIERIAAASRHRPFNPSGEEYRAFCRKQIAAIDSLPQIDFSAERAYFERFGK